MHECHNLAIARFPVGFHLDSIEIHTEISILIHSQLIAVISRTEAMAYNSAMAESLKEIRRSILRNVLKTPLYQTSRSRYFILKEINRKIEIILEIKRGLAYLAMHAAGGFLFGHL